MQLIKINQDYDLTYLFASLTILLILVPIGHSIELVRYAINTVFTFMITEILFQHIKQKTVNFSMIIVTTSSVLMLWISTFYKAPKSEIIYTISHLIFYAYLAILLSRRVISSKTFNNNTIFGSLSIYISAAFSWGYLYALMKIVEPSTFGADYTILESQVVESMVYFSFITITTLGYGDIYPSSPFAGSFVILEVMFGQIFFAVVIAKIVSLSLVEQLKK
ncbi:MAG: ion channel [Campylobacterota bacterium]|nr:ion channel [Campylobacterota bacterium]